MTKNDESFIQTRQYPGQRSNPPQLLLGKNKLKSYVTFCILYFCTLMCTFFPSKKKTWCISWGTRWHVRATVPEEPINKELKSPCRIIKRLLRNLTRIWPLWIFTWRGSASRRCWRALALSNFDCERTGCGLTSFNGAAMSAKREKKKQVTKMSTEYTLVWKTFWEVVLMNI